MPKPKRPAGASKTTRRRNAAVIQLPESDMLQAAKLKPQVLEEMVRGILGSQSGRGIDQVILKGGRASGPADAPSTWFKTLWTRNC